MNRFLAMGFAAAVLVAGNATSFAQTSSAALPTPVDTFATTHHQIEINGKTIHYTAQAGLLPIVDNDTGELMARMFVMSYTVDRAPGQPPRPISFVWNGGPGSNSAQIQVMGFGPKGFKVPASYVDWNQDVPPSEIADRPDTWLDVSDLVFVDPIGTGYSRATSDKYRDILYTTRGDGEAVAEMIRVYKERFNTGDAPIFLVGESYGTTRAQEVAADMERRRAHLAGIMLISGFYDVGQKIPSALNTALEVPMYTATAHYFKLLPPDLQALPRDEAVRRAEEWARNEYAPALEKRDSLTMDQRIAVLDQLKRYAGIDPHFVNARTLSIWSQEYLDDLLLDRGLELGRYDSRMAIPHRSVAAAWLVDKDPSIHPMIDLMEGTSLPYNRFIRETLQYKNDLMYRGPFGESFHPLPLSKTSSGLYDDSMSAMWDRGVPGSQEESTRGENGGAGNDPSGYVPLRAAMEWNPKLLILVAQGMYDGIIGTSCAGKAEAAARTPAGLRERVRTACYGGGHMMYTEASVRRDMKRDFVQFVHDGVAALSSSK